MIFTIQVTLVCPLTKSTSAQIRLSTNSNQQANYVVQFIDNDLNAFTSKAIVSIYPQKSQQIKVNFFARKILKTKGRLYICQFKCFIPLINIVFFIRCLLTFAAYLVLCGSSIGPHFAENQVFLLEGYPDELEISESFSFATKLYQIVKKNLNINVPYDNPKEYEIWVSKERPNSIGIFMINIQKSELPFAISFVNFFSTRSTCDHKVGWCALFETCLRSFDVSR